MLTPAAQGSGPKFGPSRFSGEPCPTQTSAEVCAESAQGAHLSALKHFPHAPGRLGASRAFLAPEKLFLREFRITLIDGVLVLRRFSRVRPLRSACCESGGLTLSAGRHLDRQPGLAFRRLGVAQITVIFADRLPSGCAAFLGKQF